MNLLNLSPYDAVQYVLNTKKSYLFSNYLLRPARGKICIEQNHKLKYMKVKKSIDFLYANI